MGICVGHMVGLRARVGRGYGHMRRDMGICGWCGDGDGDRWWGYGHMRGGHMWVGVRMRKRKGGRGGEGDRAALN